MNVDFKQQLIDVRAKYDLSQRDMAKIGGVSLSTYQGIEVGNTSDQSRMAKRVRENAIDNEQAIKQFFSEKRKKANKYRIPNIPGFYERLDEITDENGNVDPLLNLKVFNDLQKDLGVTAVTSGRESHSAFGELIRKYRGRRSQREIAKIVGVSYSTYSNAERGGYNSTSHTIRSIVNSQGCYTDEQKAEIKRAYKRMQKEEKK